MQHGYTQAALAEIVGIHPRTLGYWELGKHAPTPGDPIIRTAVVLGTTVGYLLTGRNR